MPNRSSPTSCVTPERPTPTRRARMTTRRATAATVVVGAGRGGPRGELRRGGDYTDPWHPFGEAAERLGAVLVSEGLSVAIVDTVEALGVEMRDAELLVLNAGSGDEANPLDAKFLGLVEAHLASGRPLLAVHAAASLFPELAAWEQLLGGRWVRGVSWHPPLGEAHLEL